MLHAVVVATTPAQYVRARPAPVVDADRISQHLEAPVTDTPTLPALGDLLKDSPTNWGKWGDDDEVGALNYLGPEQVLAAVRLVRSGKVFTLQRLIGDPKGDPVWPGRTPAVRTQVLDEGDWDEGGKGPAYPGGLHYADDKIDAFLQGSTQYDALGHVWYDGKIWNGYDARTTIGGLDKASVAADRRARRRRPRRC